MMMIQDASCRSQAVPQGECSSHPSLPKVKQSALVTESVSPNFAIIFPEDLCVVLEDPRVLRDRDFRDRDQRDRGQRDGSLCKILELFDDFVPRWGEVFELYGMLAAGMGDVALVRMFM